MKQNHVATIYTTSTGANPTMQATGITALLQIVTILQDASTQAIRLLDQPADGLTIAEAREAAEIVNMFTEKIHRTTTELRELLQTPGTNRLSS